MSLFALVLTVQASAQGPDIPWNQDYAQARRQAAAERKPLAVILGSGQKGFSQLSPEGLSKEASNLLSSNYIPVYVDTSTPNGKRLADAFEMPSGKGMVLSDRSGAYQNFWHEGSMSSQDLVDRLKTYTADPTSTRSSYYGGASNPYSGGAYNPYSGGAYNPYYGAAGYPYGGMMQPASFCPSCRR